MSAAQYYLKRREYLGQIKRAYGGNVSSWGPWRDSTSFETEKEARLAFSRVNGIGLWEYGIFYRAKRLPKDAPISSPLSPSNL